MDYRGHQLNYLEVIRRPKGGIPLDPKFVYGVDTESFYSYELDRLHTSMVPIADDQYDYVLEPQCGSSPFHHMIDLPFNRFAKNSHGKLRPAQTSLTREPGKRGRGRTKMPEVLLVFYNLEYDIQRLFLPDSPFFEMARINIEGLKIDVDGYELENVHMVLSGSAPHFTIIIRRDDKILKFYGIDLWGYLKEGLGVSAKALGVVDKIAVDKEYFHIPIEELTKEELQELRIYAKRDARTTRELYLTLLYFLTQFSPEVITKKGILPPSAPAAAARIMFSRLKNPILNQSPKWAVQIALEAYSGGLVFARVRGRVRGITVGDRTSAYPTMMTLLPDPEQIQYIFRKNMSITEIIGKIGFCVASFVHVGDIIPFVTTFDGTQRSNHAPGRYERQSISIYEITAGHLLGYIKEITIHEVVFLDFSEEALGTGILYDHITQMFKVKNESEKGSAMYLLAKLMMNSPYGKLIETRSPESMLLPSFIKNLRVPSSWEWLLENNKDFKIRFYQSLMRRLIDIDQLMEDFPLKSQDTLMTIEELTGKMKLIAGTYFFPFYASLITAGQRAWMSIFTYFTKAFLADTDSAFSPLNKEEFVQALILADQFTQKIGVGRCRIGKELGDVDIELENGAGFIAGIKQYALKSGDKMKFAHHAMISPQLEDQTPESLKEWFYENIGRLANLKKVVYQTRPRPVKIKTALLRGKDFGRFESDRRKIEPKEDDRMIPAKVTSDLIFYKWRWKK